MYNDCNNGQDPSYLPVRPPYDLAGTAFILSRGDHSFRYFHENSLYLTLSIDGVPRVIRVRGTGIPGEQTLGVTVSGDNLDQEARAGAICQVRHMLAVDEDIRPFYTRMASDRVMSPVMTALCGMRLLSSPTVFEALVDSVIEQQIAITAAITIRKRFIRTVGTYVEGECGSSWCYPAPGQVCGTPPEVLRGCGLSGRKAEYIQTIAGLAARGDLDTASLMREPDTGTLIRELMRIRGVGRWTAELSALRGLRRYDAFPADDLGLRRDISSFYSGGRRLTAGETRDIARSWEPWQGLAAYYLMVARMKGMGP